MRRHHHFAVHGDLIPGLNKEEVALFEGIRQHFGVFGVIRRTFNSFAFTSLRALRRLSAWARPLPSAMDSAKFAKRTVNHKINAMARTYPAFFFIAYPKKVRKYRMDVRITPI